MKQSFLDFDFDPSKNRIKKYVISVPATTTDFADFKVDLMGKYLYIARLRVSPLTGDWCSIKFNDINEPSFQIKQGDLFKFDFYRFYFTADDVVGNAENDIIFYSWFYGDYKNLSNDTFRSRFISFSASTQYQLKGEVEGIYVTTFGNLVIGDALDQSQVFSNVPAGSYLRVNPKIILVATTCTGFVIYKE